MGSDASAAIGITARLGAGRVRHLEAKELWIQEKVRAKEVTTTKIGTKVNRADLLTKFLDGAQHHALLALLPLLWATTRCGSRTAAVAALILTMPAEAREEYDDEASAMIGWSVVVLAAALAWVRRLFAHGGFPPRDAQRPRRHQCRRTTWSLQFDKLLYLMIAGTITTDRRGST